MIQTFLADRWRRAGLMSGDLILIHSSLKRTLSEARKLDKTATIHDVLQSLLDVLGSKGTLVLPTFNFSFCEGLSFDIRHTPSKMGGLTEAGRNHPDAIRTGHPVYSFAIIGQKARYFESVDNVSAYSKESPFGILTKLNGKIGCIDTIETGSVTYYHYVEEILKVPYRYFKNFTGNYTDIAGKTEERTYQIYVRDIEKGVKTDVNAAGESMWREGCYTGFRPEIDAGLRIAHAQDMFSLTEQIILEGKALGHLYFLDSEKA